MNIKFLIILFAFMIFSHNAFSCEKSDKAHITTQIKAKDIVNIAIGKNIKAQTKIGSLQSDDNQHFDIEEGVIILKSIGDNVSACLELPSGNTNCN